MQAKRRSTDSGYTLIEAVISVALLGIIAIPVVDGVRVAIQISATSRVAARVESALINSADRVNRAPVTCDYSEYAQAAVQTQGWNADRAITVTQWFDVTTDDWSNDSDGCRFDAPTSDLVQRVRISITSPDGTITRSLEVVKSRV